MEEPSSVSFVDDRRAVAMAEGWPIVKTFFVVLRELRG
jgi:hypothetical protein